MLIQSNLDYPDSLGLDIIIVIILFGNAGYNYGNQWGWVDLQNLIKCETINKIIYIKNLMTFKYTTNYN